MAASAAAVWLEPDLGDLPVPRQLEPTGRIRLRVSHDEGAEEALAAAEERPGAGNARVGKVGGSEPAPHTDRGLKSFDRATRRGVFGGAGGVADRDAKRMQCLLRIELAQAGCNGG